jgi:hypothetical protein
VFYTEQKKAELELARAREAEKVAKSYDGLFTEETGYGGEARKTVEEMEEDFM